MPPSESSWSDFTSTSGANRRAGGRSHYNGMRQFNAAMRRVEVGKLITQYGVGCGTRARIARELHVHPSTITRDIQRLWAAEGEKCPTCERWMHYKKWEQLEEDQTTYRRNVLAATRATSEVA